MIRPPLHVPTPSHSDQSPLCHRISPSSLTSTHDYPPSAPPTSPPTFDTFSPPHTTGISKLKPVDDLVHHADFLHTHGGSLSPRQQSLLSQRRRFFRSADGIPSAIFDRSRPKPPLPFPSQVRLRRNIRDKDGVQNTASLPSCPLLVMQRFRRIEGPTQLALLRVETGTIVMQGHCME
jgi:hypothetical protein